MKAFFGVLLIFFMAACEESTSGEPQQGTTIYYYPAANIYFDADNEQYYVLAGAEGWTTKKELPEQEATALGKKVNVENPPIPVWKANGDHKMIYSATLYTTGQDYQEKFLEDSVKSMPKKNTLAANRSVRGDTTVEKKDKTKVGKFIDRLFGGKGKKEKKDKERDESSS